MQTLNQTNKSIVINGRYKVQKELHSSHILTQSFKVVDTQSQNKEYQQYVLKLFLKEHSFEQFDKEKFIHDLLQEFPFFIKAIGSYINDENSGYSLNLGNDQETFAQYAYLQFPYYKNGSLLEAIQRSKEQRMLIITQRHLALQILNAVYILHDVHQIAHRDLNPDNIIFKDDFSIGITDYEDAVYNCNEERFDYCGSTGQQPEEVLLAKKYPGIFPYLPCKVDIYTYGSIVFTMYYGENPFYYENFTDRKRTPREVIEYLQQKELQYQEGSIEREMMKVVISCMSLNYRDRPTAQQIFQDFMYIRDAHYEINNEIHQDLVRLMKND